jgi:hypothetical protein
MDFRWKFTQDSCNFYFPSTSRNGFHGKGVIRIDALLWSAKLAGGLDKDLFPPTRSRAYIFHVEIILPYTYIKYTNSNLVHKRQPGLVNKKVDEESKTVPGV